MYILKWQMRSDVRNGQQINNNHATEKQQVMKSTSRYLFGLVVNVVLFVFFVFVFVCVLSVSQLTISYI